MKSKEEDQEVVPNAMSPRSDLLPQDEEELVTLMSSYCAAYFNLAVSYEHLR